MKRLLSICLSLVAGGALASTFDTARTHPILALSNGNLTVTNASDYPTIMLCVDNSVQKAWIFNPHVDTNDGWNYSASLAAQDPTIGSQTGGRTAPGSGTIYPAFSGFGGSAADTITANFGATPFINKMPTGFSSVNTVAGTAVTWNSADKSANITLSNGDLTASNASSSSWSMVRATNGFTIASNARFCYEITPSSIDSADGIVFGVANATQSLSSYVGSSTNSAGGQADANWWYNAAASGGNGADFKTKTNVWKASMGTGVGTGKRCFEIVTTTVDAANVTLGIAIPNSYRQSAIGARPPYQNYLMGWGYQSGGASAGVYWLNGASGSKDGYASGDTVMICTDSAAQMLWAKPSSSANWNTNASANPTTGTLGINISTIGSTYYPAVSFMNNANVATLRTVEPFTNTLPSGFLAWDVVSGARPIIFGSVVDRGDRCERVG